MEKIVKIKLDFVKLRDYLSDDKEKLPIHGMVGFYRASGVLEAWQKFLQDRNLDGADPKQYMFCNSSTMMTMRGLIENNWQTFNIDLLDNNKVEWKPKEPHARRKRPKKWKAKIRNSVNYDFGYYCPMLDEEVEDDTIVIRDESDEVKDAVIVEK